MNTGGILVTPVCQSKTGAAIGKSGRSVRQTSTYSYFSSIRPLMNDGPATPYSPGSSSTARGRDILQLQANRFGALIAADPRAAGSTEYADGLSGYNWSHWGTFTWRPRKELLMADGQHAVRRYDSFGGTVGNMPRKGITSPAKHHAGCPRTLHSTQIDPISLPAVRSAVGRWCYRIKPRAIWWATEPGGRFGRHHIHMLASLSDKSMERDPWSLAFRWFGRSEIEEYDPERGAAHYVGKYVTKELSDHDFYTRRTGYHS